MVREIKFRGKRADNGEWVYGYLAVYTDGSCYIATEIERNVLRYVKGKPSYVFDCIEYEVDPKTVGQYTGLKDKNGVEIYEGDILACGDGRVPTLVFWDTENNCWSARNLPRQEEHKLNKHFKRFIGEVISNKWDDSSLLLGGKQDDS